MIISDPSYKFDDNYTYLVVTVEPGTWYIHDIVRKNHRIMELSIKYQKPIKINKIINQIVHYEKHKYNHIGYVGVDTGQLTFCDFKTFRAIC